MWLVFAMPGAEVLSLTMIPPLSAALDIDHLNDAQILRLAQCFSMH
jgi:hypothetical protein